MADTKAPTAPATDKVVEIPPEVKPKRQPREPQVYKTRDEMEKAHPGIKEKAQAKAKEKGRKRVGGGKQFKVTMNGTDYWTIASGKKDAYARTCAYLGVNVERLDAEAREPRSIKSSYDDVFAAIQNDTKMPEAQRKQLADALKRIQEAQAASDAAKAAAAAPTPK